MGRSHVTRYINRIRLELREALGERHTPREIAWSFALGTFITILPTFGVGLLGFVLIIYRFEWVSKLALFSTVLVFNPVVKWGIYVASFMLGVLLLNPIESVSMTDVSFDAAPAIVVRLLVGNLILAVVASIGSYVVIHRLAARYAATRLAETVDEVLEEVAETILEVD